MPQDWQESSLKSAIKQKKVENQNMLQIMTRETATTFFQSELCFC